MRSIEIKASAFLVLLLALTATPATAAPPGFAFLEIPTGARASAVGGAFASMGQGVEAMFWNPAGLAATRETQVIGGHYELFENLRHDHFAVSKAMLGGAGSASIRALYSEPIDERDESGNLIGSFGSHDLEFGLGYGREVGDGLALGVSAQLLRERIASSSITTFAMGLGATWEPQALAGLRLGVEAQNLGPAGHYDLDGFQGEAVSLPAAFQGGLSYALPVGTNLAVRGAVEARVTRGRNGVGMVGAEISSPVGAALRVGLRANDDAATVSFGAGYTVHSLKLDYAYVPLQLDLGDTHRFGFTAQF